MDKKKLWKTTLEILRVVRYKVASFMRQRYLYTIIKSQCVQRAYNKNTFTDHCNAIE